MGIIRWIFILVLFVMSAGFQLFIFTALLQSEGHLYLVDPFPEVRLLEFVLASAVFLVAILATYDFFVKLIGRDDPFD